MATSKTIKEIDETREKEELKILEAVLFISGRYLGMQELISLSDLNPIIIGDLIERLKDKYNKEDSALEITEKNGMWKMDVRQEYTSIINRLATGTAEFSKAEQETLAIIAYKQPIKQSVIIKIRGNKAYEHIKKLTDLELIKRKKAGHTHELSLSEDFYDYFSVSENERTSVPGLNEEIKKEIEEVEKEVEAEEQGSSDEFGENSEEAAGNVGEAEGNEEEEGEEVEIDVVKGEDDSEEEVEEDEENSSQESLKE